MIYVDGDAEMRNVKPIPGGWGHCGGHLMTWEVLLDLFHCPECGGKFDGKSLYRAMAKRAQEKPKE